MWRRLVKVGRSQPGSSCRSALPGASRCLSTNGAFGGDSKVRLRSTLVPGSRRGASTQLGAYLEQSGAVWGDAVESQEVSSSPCKGGTAWSWRVDLPTDRLTSMRRGAPLESPPFTLGGTSRTKVRFQFFPKGDADCEAEGMCSLWLWSDDGLGPIALRLGSAERNAGSSEFCKLEDAMKDGHVDISLEVQAADVPAPSAAPAVQQSLHLSGLQLAEWRIFQMSKLRDSADLVSSPPFRFHHVLLGDMYLELMFASPHLATVFFRCRVPTMKLKVGLSVGTNFSKSFVAQGLNTTENDIKTSSCLQVNLDAPGVLSPDGDLTVRCTLEEVVSLPPALRDMIPRLDERAAYPKRL